MNRRYHRKASKTKEILVTHLENNFKEYIIITIIFVIGIIIGVVFINNTSENQSLEISNYISNFINGLKENKEIDELTLLKDSIKKNCVLAVFLWFMGSTIIGISIVYLTVCFRGFCLGYTISSIILTCGTRKRFTVFIFNNIIAKHIIHPLCNCTCSKWNEIT
ncbi:MAG: stage II sporulation protein M [Clostridia bacterium]|nr:stage II sporulation protein M [Clostridia bacterium]